MAVKVLIKRSNALGTEKGLSDLLRQMRTLTTNRKGYISGETFRRLDKPGESLVISNWRSLDDWNEWSHSTERKEIQSKIDSLLGHATIYEIYGYD